MNTPTRLLFGTAFALLVGCGITPSTSSSSGAGCTGEVPEHGPDEAVGWKCIDAEAGGRVDIPGGAWLDVPPGALDVSRRIVVKVPSPSPATSRSYKLEPSGLVFNKPLTLHAPYLTNAAGKPLPATVFHASDLHPTVSAKSELTNWKHVEVTRLEPETKTIAAEISHFSSVYYFYQVDEFAYLVVDLPTKYLQAGDILATLTHRDATEGPDWDPGHIGMVHEIAPSGTVGTVIESTPPDGVGKTSIDAFKTEYGHLFLGARRPAGPPLTKAERKGLVTFTQAQNGKPYNLIGEGNLTNGSFSCVGLVEAAHDDIGRSNIPWNGEFFAITPVEMFRATRPITEIRERAEQAIEIPLYGITLDARSPYVGTTVRGFYQRGYDYEIKASSKPEGSELTGSPMSGYTFKWTPKVEDGCEATGNGQPCPADGMPHLLVLELDATPRVTIVDGAKVALDPVHVTETVTVHVTSHSRLFPVAPVAPNDSHEFSVTIPLPANATFKSAALRDEATKGAVSLAPFPGHTVEILSEGYDEKANAAHLAVRVTNHTGTALTAAPATWRYTLHYDRTLYRGEP